MTRPRLLLGVVGTATEVGKTWVGAALLAELRRRGVLVAARKPLQSHDPDELGPLDADVLARATGEAVEDVCTPAATFPIAMAPPMAADALGLARPTTAAVLAAVAPDAWPDAASGVVEVGLVETVGGVASPMTADAHSAEVLAAIVVDVTLLIADAGLGTIDAVRTAMAVLGPLGITPVVVFLNRFDADDDLHRRNRDWLVGDGVDVVVSVTALADRWGG